MADLADLVPSDYVIVEIEEALLRRLAPELLTEARGWQPAGKAGWSYMVHPARPEMRQLRHVHVARDEHTRAKNKQVAWNDDGTRHDKKTFDANMKGIGTAREIARSVLNLPQDLVLEQANDSPERGTLLTEAVSARESPVVGATFLVVRVRDAAPWDRYL